MLHDAFDPFFVLVEVCAGLGAICWLVSVLTREYSWVDRLWSLAPPAYAWILAAETRFAVGRVVLVAVLTTLWGARLTYNFARKGGYAKGGEDYRWLHLRERIPGFAFQLLNLVFIAGAQNVLLMLLVTPALAAAKNPSPLGPADALVSGAFLACLALETKADEDQWRFQERKRTRRARGEPGPEICTEGLFRYSRHPNFFFEISLWWVVYGFTVVATGAWLHWTILGAVSLTALFQGSTSMTENITRAKYGAEFDAYRARTSRLVPWWPGAGRARRAPASPASP
ncbi:DUF1295 domain-containing protein [bacterium]|nr:MAG: DUF1295 domain-containing protein [bacterium]